MKKATSRGIIVAGVLAALLTLTGCAASSASAVKEHISSAQGVQGVNVVVSHPGAPWNTTTLITLFIPDSSAQSMITALRSSTAAIANDPVAKHDVVFYLVPGKPSDYPDLDSSDPELDIPKAVFDDLGVEYDPGTSIRLTSEDITRIAAES